MMGVAQGGRTRTQNCSIWRLRESTEAKTAAQGWWLRKGRASDVRRCQQRPIVVGAGGRCSSWLMAVVLAGRWRTATRARSINVTLPLPLEVEWRWTRKFEEVRRGRQLALDGGDTRPGHISRCSMVNLRQRAGISDVQFHEPARRWCLRGAVAAPIYLPSFAAGLRPTVAPVCFLYHSGRFGTGSPASLFARK